MTAETTVAPILTAHPYADKFPMLPQSELEELAESIRANGLRQPVVVTPDGLILDGRNRVAACALLGIEPETVIYGGDDLAEYVIDSNVTRRNMTTGARAMATALVLVEAGKRHDGRFAYGALANSTQVSDSFAARLREAGVVLDWTPGAIAAVVTGELSLKIAYVEACAARDAVDTAKRAKAIEANRKREETIREREANDRMLAALTAASSKYLANVEAGDMTIKAAHAAHMADTEKERRDAAELDAGRQGTMRRISECVAFLEGGEQYAAIFLRDAYPHEQRFLTEPQWLTRERVQSAIDFLTAIKKELRA